MGVRPSLCGQNLGEDGERPICDFSWSDVPAAGTEYRDNRLVGRVVLYRSVYPTAGRDSTDGKGAKESL